MSAVAVDRAATGIHIGADNVVHDLGVEARRKLIVFDELAKQRRDLAALEDRRVAGGGRRRGGRFVAGFGRTTLGGASRPIASSKRRR